MPLGLPSIEFQTNKIYRAPAYLRLAIKRKLNNEDIFVLGVPKDELKQFWEGVSYHALEITMPTEKGRAVVDIDSRCHANDATRMQMDMDENTIQLQNNGTGEGKVPDDYYDEFKITSRKDDSKEHEKSFRLEFSSSTTKGANFNLQLTNGGFFNTAAPISSSSLGGSFSKTETKTSSNQERVSESLTQGYEIVDTLKVPPKTKVEATIRTWAVTYESETKTEVTVDAKAALTVRYRTMLSRRLGGILVSSVPITAQELFCHEWDYKCENELVTFKRKGKISHLGEQVEIIKKKDRTV
jgi:hypothetical protein